MKPAVTLTRRFGAPLRRSHSLVLSLVVHTAVLTGVLSSGLSGGLTVSAQQASSDSVSADTLDSMQVSAPLQPGDLVAVDVFNTPELSATARLAADGAVSIPLVGKVAVVGLTPLDAAMAIQQRLLDDRILLRPSVSVRVLERSMREVTVLGEVNKPGNYVLRGRESLYEAIAAAGGLTDRPGPVITLTRRGAEDLTVDVDRLKLNDSQFRTSIQPGDVVVVSRAPSIYVVGDVARPGEFVLAGGERVGTLNAVALAAGLNRTAAASRASIIRQTGDGATTIEVDLKEIAQNRAEDPLLRGGDVLVVPRSGARSFIEFSLPGAASALIGSVTAALILR